MSAQITPEERAALPVARAALESRASAYGVSDTIVFALGSAGLLQSPETAAEVQALREQLAARTFYLADVEGIEDGQSLHATADAAKAWVDEIGGPDGDWFERDGVWEQWHTDLDTDRPSSRGSGRVLPLVVQGDGIVAEAEWLRQGLLEKSRKLGLLMDVRADEQDHIRRLQTEQGQVMKALGCESPDDWDEVAYRARQLAAGQAVSS
jgi:hypothetical protein